MTAPQAEAPTIRNAGTKAVNRRQLFVNIPVSDLQRSIDFYEALGFTFNLQFTDATATCMLVGDDAYFMLLTHDKFKGFTNRPIADPRNGTAALYAFGVGSRAEVDDIVAKAIASGGSRALGANDHGFMYQWSFLDPDGHHFEVFWMDPSVLEQQGE